jgi:hypothetical protein
VGAIRTVSAPRIGMVGGKDMFRKIVSNLDKIFPDVTYVSIDEEYWRNAATDSALSRDDRPRLSNAASARERRLGRSSGGKAVRFFIIRSPMRYPSVEEHLSLQIRR